MDPTLSLPESADPGSAPRDALLAELRLSEARLRLIFDNVPALIGYFDRNHVYQYANKGYTDWFGRGRDIAAGRPIVDVLPPEVYAVVIPHVVLALKGSRQRYEYEMARDDGRIVNARTELVPEFGPDGEVLGCFVLSVDVSEVKQAQVAIAQAQKMEAVGQLTGGIAHDLNNMLAVMIGNLAALRDRRPGDPELAEFLTPALKAAHSGADLIRRLLTFARQQPLAPRAVDVGEVVADAAQLLVRSLPDSVRLLTSLAAPRQRLIARTDAHQLESAILNLAINARDAMPEGGELRIETDECLLDAAEAAEAEVLPGRHVRISVTDTGIGMDEATRARVFEPFFTTKRFGQGSGLGLPMVYGFVRQCGGGVLLHSRPGAGTRVTLLLQPAEMPAAATAPTTAAPGTPADAAVIESPQAADMPPRPGRPLVLLVDDQAELRRIVRRELVALGHPVIEAGDGDEAREILDAVPGIGLLITDIVMPGRTDGRALCRHAARTRPGLRMLMISGYSDEQPGRASDPWPLLRKPFTPEELRSTLEETLK
ncbi:PAS domain S-box-containing protein [Sphaerotilus sulfidivorans]|uniref:histidine kinase n=1 Tax=Sphaerotilus sulfidivorans TaxID=639200 RepID=A0A5C1PY00_9BURK|nr:PAS domain-containing sensor histidine kinase [Sphaerotilus sulfidivorans]NZD44389.1 PAS domain-containing protein [Sphaerotilus sulfidivorans]QEN00091.1 PAS domain-containing sensor histidine kinase [Sphaerotilus sulfidivorans]